MRLLKRFLAPLKRFLAPLCCVSLVTSQILTAGPYESQIDQIEVKSTTSKFVQPVSETAIAQYARLNTFATRISPPLKRPERNWLLDDLSPDGSRVPELALHAPVAGAADMVGEDYSATYFWGVAASAAAVVTVVGFGWAVLPVAAVSAAVEAGAAVVNAYEVFTEGTGSAALAEAQAEANAAQQNLAAQENVPTQEAGQEAQAVAESVNELAATDPAALAAVEQWAEQNTTGGYGWARPHDTKELYVAAKRKLMLSTELDLPIYAL